MRGKLYEMISCARGDMENRIKECQLDLFADRTSTTTMQANQFRLWFACMAHVPLCGLRRVGLAHTQLAEATYDTIRLKLSVWSGSTCGGSRCHGVSLPVAGRVRTRACPTAQRHCLIRTRHGIGTMLSHQRRRDRGEGGTWLEFGAFWCNETAQ